ncbi:glycoside hydrolase family 15 protein [Corallococcus exiguus]|uniref:Glycoside hydrolase family 15 protein n=1 Tax=Corallococcus exiguus TaxID=83462 RepID=A0A7X4YFR0_9BACT|nr:glycoside hydrolase family 15 protein [Corallococcus exiguus]NBC44425.1 glycoside hydrolase family 15 protein [Corallococcus exiguus]TNV55686.1 glycoside hydrolase family 15 protein [Corallococcus exiguus]
MAEQITQKQKAQEPVIPAQLGVQTNRKIEDHALIGNMRSAALVARDGTIDWLCLPDFDSDACFASLLGTEENGEWALAPRESIQKITRRYRKDTLILETDFTCASGTVRLIDFMPVGQEFPRIVRTVVGVKGTVAMHSKLTPRFAFGRSIPRVESVGGSLRAFAGPDALFLRRTDRDTASPLVSNFEVTAGQRFSWVMSWNYSWLDQVPPNLDAEKAEQETDRYWTQWVSKIVPPPRYRDEVVRSLITIKACSYESTGGIVAAPTTSLPETPGGERNWDYRFTWLRDAVLAHNALNRAGLSDEASSFWKWVMRAIAGDPAQMQIMYGIRGERRLTESELDWLDGYGGAKPVRIGNGAYNQFQLDVLGEVAAVLYAGAKYFGEVGPVAQRALLNVAEHAMKVWQNPDKGIWEMRGPNRHFTASKVAAWAALDRAIKASDETKMAAPMERLLEARETIFEEVCAQGFNRELNSFTQYYGGKQMDASLLYIPLTGFLPATDPRVVSTVECIERELLQDGLVLRFKPDPTGSVDGLSGEEGTFLACSFWLADVYQMMGRFEDARRLFEHLLSLSNDLGLLAEEYMPKLHAQLGNFPQAFSHFSLVTAAYTLTEPRA